MNLSSIRSLASSILLLASPTFAAPSGGELSIKNMTYGGTGCPQGSVGELIAPDGRSMTMIFDQYSVTNDGTGQGWVSKNCNIQLEFVSPNGWQFAFFSMDVRGYGNFDKHTGGYFDLKTEVKGGKSSWYQHFDGGFSSDFKFVKEFSDAELKWSTCSSNSKEVTPLKIQTLIGVTAINKAQGFLSVDSIDGDTYEYEQDYGIKWKQCPNQNPSFTTTCEATPAKFGSVQPAKITSSGVGSSEKDAKKAAFAQFLEICKRQNPGISDIGCIRNAPKCRTTKN